MGYNVSWFKLRKDKNMKRMFGICAGVVLSLFLLNSCSGEKKSAESVDTKEGGAIDSSKIVAVVNGVNITESDLLKKIEEGKTNQIQMGGSFRKEALANLINYNLPNSFKVTCHYLNKKVIFPKNRVYFFDFWLV